MKKLFFLLAGLCLSYVFSLSVCASVITLHDGWVLQNHYPTSVPSTVMGILTENGEYGGILEGMNYKSVDCTRFEVPWTYENHFKLTDKELQGHHIFLQLDGISYRADIILNGKVLATKDQIFGTYCRHRLDITQDVQRDNDLKIEVYRAQKGEPNAGFVDWNPGPVDGNMGIIRPVSIIVCGDVLLSDPAVYSLVNKHTLKEAWLQLNTVIENVSDHEVTGHLVGSFDGRKFQWPMTLEPHQRRLLRLNDEDVEALHVLAPRLWWSRDLGKPDLYRMHLEFVSANGTEDADDFTFGIREINDYYTSNGDRGFTLNGKRLLIRGGGWTDDIFMRDTPSSNAAQLKMVCDMNLNAIRMENIWGGSQDIFNRCDSLGILVLPGWTCHWEWEDYLGKKCDILYGGMTSEADVTLMTRYFHDQVLWLRRHPSIICWFIGSDKLPAPELEQNYLLILNKLDPSRPHITSAKKLESGLTGTAGMKMAGPYDYVSPSYWYEKRAPGGAFGFNSETGIGAQLPQKEDIVRMVGTDHLWPVDSVWNYHCTASTSSMSTLDRLQEVLGERYGETGTLDAFLHCADLANYESTRAMFESFRVNVPRATGIIQWMLNSARPGMYWQLYDYYGVPNAAYYGVKNGNAPLQLIYDYGQRKVMMANSTLNRHEAIAEMDLYDTDGRQLSHQVKLAEAKEINYAGVFQVPAFRPDNAFLFLKLKDRAGNLLAHNVYVLAKDSDVYDWAKSTWITTPVRHYASYEALSSLPVVDVKVVVNTSGKKESGKVKIVLNNPTNHVAFFLRMALVDRQGTLVSPVFYSDNYISLEPHQQTTVTCDLSQLKTKSKLRLKVEGWNIKPLSISLN